MAVPTPSDTFWTAPGGAAFPSLEGDLQVDVAVVGGGIVGLSAARYLACAGKRVAVLEARRIGRQITGGSTAKVTAQHTLAYQRIARNFNENVARVYAEANQWAVEEMAGLVDALGIDCSFVRRPAYVFTADLSRVSDLEEEARLAASFGLPARVIDSLPLAVPAVGALVFDGQAQFDPYAYLQGLAADVVEAGGRIFERSRVMDIPDDAPRRVRTAEGTVTATDVIVATGLPIRDDGTYYARTAPKAHLTLAARVRGEAPEGMFISVDEPTHSMRWQQRDGETWLVLVGPKFQPGSIDTAEGFRDLEQYARTYFPVESVEYRWWNEDFYSVEGMPYVGLATEATAHLYVATGFSGWGLTTGTASARILADVITGAPNPWADAFASTRSPLFSDSPFASAVEFVKGNLATLKELVSSYLPQHGDVAALAPGDGTVIEVDDEQIAVSRAEDGSLRVLSATCTHLGCTVSWNRAMQTWDCGCHGSCFSADGAVLRGPAVEDLEVLTGQVSG